MESRDRAARIGHKQRKQVVGGGLRESSNRQRKNGWRLEAAE